MDDDSKEPTHEGPPRGMALAPRSSPYPTSRLAPAFGVVDVARQIAEADLLLGSVTEARLDVIARQIRGLQEEARRILEETARDLALHRAEARFVKRPGTVYHAYDRANGERFLSLVAPAEWGARLPGTFVGSYRLEADQRWTPVG